MSLSAHGDDADFTVVLFKRSRLQIRQSILASMENKLKEY
jgi:hypothetical protein